MAEPSEREIESAGGVRLFVRTWSPGAGAGAAEGAAARGVLAVVPGFSDHGGRYPLLVDAALAEGYAVASFDTRGHGRSTGRRGHVESFDDYLLDLDRFLAEAGGGRAAGAPLVVWGHSMGALIVIAYLAAGFGRGAGIAAAVACAPPFRIVTPIPLWKTTMAKALSRVLPAVPFKSEIRPDDLSRDTSVGERYVKDPLCHHICSPRLYTEMTSTASRLFSNPLDYGVPTLFIHGGGDPIIDVSGTRSYFGRSPLAAKDLRVYEGARHEVHNDPAGPEAFRDAFAFFAAHAAPRLTPAKA